MAIVQYTSESTYAVSGKYEYVDIIKEFAHGCVIRTGYRDIRIMSDVWSTEFFADYWDEKTQSIQSIGLYCGESSEWNRHSKAVVDATDEVWEQVEKFHYKQEYRSLENEALKEAKTVRKDSLVKVTGGRYNKGTEGKVVAIIQRSYGMGYRSQIENKLGIATSEAKIEKRVGNKVYENYRDMVWVWARNVDLTVTPAIDIAKIKQSAQYRAKARVQSLRKSL